MNIRYQVELSEAERCELTALLSSGKHAARKLKRAQILLAADAGGSDEEMSHGGGGSSTVYRTKRRFVEDNWTGTERATAAGGRAQAHRQGRSPADRDRLFSPPEAAPAGPWNCWPARWSASPSTGACRARRCGGVWPRTT